MSQSTDPRPEKPYPGFPLFAHQNGQWAKKIRGKLHYFGVWDDADAALELFVRQRDDLYAGREPQAGGGLTIERLCDAFYHSKRHLYDTREITHRTLQDYHWTCQRLIRMLGNTATVESLTADDFRQMRAEIAATRKVVALGTEIQRIRTIFKFALDEGLIDRPVNFGQGFGKPPRKAVRQSRRESGSRMFEAAELRQLVAGATKVMRAMIYLGINGGFGQSDLSQMPQSVLSDGWIDFARPKTEAHRRCPLWPETIATLEAAAAKRPKPRDPADQHLLFLTTQGTQFVKMTPNGWPDDAIGKRFKRLLKRLEIDRPRLNFYALRHTFRTVADESGDQPAIDLIMGHDRGDIASLYRERISDDRLRAVTDHVREWFLGG